MVGVLLTLYAAGVGKDEFSMVLMSRIGFNLLLVGLLPLVAALVYLQGKPITNDPSDHNREESEDIVGSQERAEQPVFSLDTGPGGEGFEVYREDLIMVEAADNYCKFHCNVNAQRKVRTFRIAMKEVARMLENEKQFSRCHRSFLINTALLDDIVGVSQAYKLKLRGIEELVPVSRSFDIAPLRELLPQFRG
jgi:DNA-binding LytR/AlgR family response regulator